MNKLLGKNKNLKIGVKYIVKNASKS